MEMPQVYCAGPLFTNSERQEMAEIAGVLEVAGYTTFLPQRDGLEFARLLPELQQLTRLSVAADSILQRAIFSLDVFQLLSRSDAVVANINGRVPDEGTVVEAALGWLSGKAVVIYKDDSRTVLSGSDHPMLIALGDFRVVNAISELPQAVSKEIHADRKDRVQKLLEVGRRIADAKQPSQHNVAASLLALLTE